MHRSLGAAERVGIRAMLVHALDDPAAAFYEEHPPSPTDPQHLMILIKDVRAALLWAGSRRRW